MNLKKLLLGGALALTAGAALANGPAPGVNSPWSPVWSLPNDSPKWSYALGFELSPLSGATDIFQICGSASGTIRVTKIMASGRATAQVAAPLFLIKRSTPTTGGQFAPQTPFLSATVGGVPHDANNQASLASVSAWQSDAGSGGALTLGTQVGVIAAGMVFLGNLTTGLPTDPVAFEWGVRPSQDIVLRGTSQCLAANLSNGTYAGNLWDFWIEWTEE